MNETGLVGLAAGVRPARRHRRRASGAAQDNAAGRYRLRQMRQQHGSPQAPIELPTHPDHIAHRQPVATAAFRPVQLIKSHYDDSNDDDDSPAAIIRAGRFACCHRRRRRCLSLVVVAGHWPRRMCRRSDREPEGGRCSLVGVIAGGFGERPETKTPLSACYRQARAVHMHTQTARNSATRLNDGRRIAPNQAGNASVNSAEEASRRRRLACATPAIGAAISSMTTNLSRFCGPLRALAARRNLLMGRTRRSAYATTEGRRSDLPAGDRGNHSREPATAIRVGAVYLAPSIWARSRLRADPTELGGSREITTSAGPAATQFRRDNWLERAPPPRRMRNNGSRAAPS
jgi:hypothetical protein